MLIKGIGNGIPLQVANCSLRMVVVTLCQCVQQELQWD